MGQPSKTPSLQESFQTIPVPQNWAWWRKMLAFAGPGYLVAVGYMDPGNWATDLSRRICFWIYWFYFKHAVCAEANAPAVQRS